MEQTDTFEMHKSHVDALKALPNIDDQLDLFYAIADYELDGLEPKLDGITKALWILIKFDLDSNCINS